MWGLSRPPLLIQNVEWGSCVQVYSPSRPPALSKNLPGELWQVGKTVTQGELEVVNPGYVFTTISSIQPGEGAADALEAALPAINSVPDAVISNRSRWPELHYF